MKFSESFKKELRGEKEKRRMKVKNPWAALGMLSAAGFLKKSAVDFFQMQTAMAYLKGVDMVRDLLFYQIGIMSCVIFFAFGFVFIQTAAVFCFPMEDAVRLKAAFIMGFIDLAGAAWALFYLTSSKRWLEQAAKYNSYLRGFIQDENQKSFFSGQRKF